MKKKPKVAATGPTQEAYDALLYKYNLSVSETVAFCGQNERLRNDYAELEQEMADLRQELAHTKELAAPAQEAMKKVPYDEDKPVMMAPVGPLHSPVISPARFSFWRWIVGDKT